MIRIAFVALILALSLTAARAESAFDELVRGLPCAAQVQTQVPAKFRSQWNSTEFPVVSHGQYPDGVALRDTIEMKAYDLGSLDNKAALIEYPIYQTRYDEQWRLWNGDSNCSVETSTHPSERSVPSFRLPGGFTDENLKSLLKDHRWGVVYLTSFFPPAVASLAALRSVVAAKDGHLTVILYEDYLSHPGVVPASALEELLRNAGIAAADLKPLASTELYIRGRQANNYPTTIVYFKGFLSNHIIRGPYHADQFGKLIREELDQLQGDLH